MNIEKLVLQKIISILLLFAFVLPAYCESQTLADNQVFRRGNYDEPDTLDPQKALAVPEYNILGDLYEGLMTFDKDGKLALGQAKSYLISKDHKTYIFKLKDNLRWSNGDPLTAFDFEAGIKRTLDPKLGSQNIVLLNSIKNSEDILFGHKSIDQLGIKATDSHTLKIKLNKPIPYLLSLLTHNTFAPIYQPNLLKYNDKFTQPKIYVTNGPFKLSEWVVNSHLTVVKNDFYRKAKTVKLNKVIFYPINQQSVELNRYRAGDLDYTAKVQFDKLAWVKSNFHNQLYELPMLAAYYYSFNLTKSPFADNLNLRKALSLAIDKDIIADRLLGGKRSATDKFVPEFTDNYINHKQSLYTDQLPNQQSRIQMAQDYYQKAGYSIDNPLKTKILFHTNESNKIIATAIASMWRKTLGVNTELVNQEWKVYLKTRLEHDDTEVVRQGWVAPYNDPTAFLDLFMSINPQNTSGYFNKQYDDILSQADNQTDYNIRAKLLHQAEQLLLNDAPMIPIYAPHAYHLVKPYVNGLNFNSHDVTKDQYIYISKTNNV